MTLKGSPQDYSFMASLVSNLSGEERMEVAKRDVSKKNIRNGKVSIQGYLSGHGLEEKKMCLWNILYFNPSTLKYKEITVTRKDTQV